MSNEFSDWVESDPEEFMFQYRGEKLNAHLFITGAEWLKLPPEEQDDYIFES